MYWRIWSGVRPFCSSSRTSWRRSTARSACESAIVWFWQTRQRSSPVMASMRASSAGSAAVRWAAGASNFTVAGADAADAAGASAAMAGRPMASASSAAIRRRASAIELPQQRQHIVAQHLGRQRADLLVADHALLVDDEGLGHAVDAEVDAHAAVGVEQRGVVRVAALGQPLLRGL